MACAICHFKHIIGTVYKIKAYMNQDLLTSSMDAKSLES